MSRTKQAKKRLKKISRQIDDMSPDQRVRLFDRLNRLQKKAETDVHVTPWQTLEEVEKETNRIYGDQSDNSTYYFSQRDMDREDEEYEMIQASRREREAAIPKAVDPVDEHAYQESKDWADTMYNGQDDNADFYPSRQEVPAEKPEQPRRSFPRKDPGMTREGPERDRPQEDHPSEVDEFPRQEPSLEPSGPSESPRDESVDLDRDVEEIDRIEDLFILEYQNAPIDEAVQSIAQRLDKDPADVRQVLSESKKVNLDQDSPLADIGESRIERVRDRGYRDASTEFPRPRQKMTMDKDTEPVDKTVEESERDAEEDYGDQSDNETYYFDRERPRDPRGVHSDKEAFWYDQEQYLLQDTEHPARESVREKDDDQEKESSRRRGRDRLTRSKKK